MKTSGYERKQKQNNVITLVYNNTKGIPPRLYEIQDSTELFSNV